MNSFENVKLDIFQKMIVRTMTRFVGPSSMTVYLDACNKINCAPESFSHADIPRFTEVLCPMIKGAMDSHRKKTFIGVLTRFKESKIGRTRIDDSTDISGKMASDLGDVVKKIQRLATMKQKGLITESDYKKAKELLLKGDQSLDLLNIDHGHSS